MQAIIKELLNHEGGICLSLIVPTAYRSFQEKDSVRIMLKNGLQEVKKALEHKYDKEVYKPLLHALQGMVTKVDLNHPATGVGIFVTQGLARLIELPFTLDYKVVISDTFEIQDILYSLDKLMDYHVLLLNKKHTRLFKGVGNILREVVDDVFPRSFEDLYEENKPAYRALYNKDPSQVEEKRVGAFMREVHHVASPYVEGAPIIIIGLDKHISRYKISGKIPWLLGEIHATYDKIAVHELTKLVWPIVERHQESLARSLAKRIEEKLARQEAVYSIQRVLEVMDEVYDVHLVVERDFEVQGYLDREGGRLLLHPLDPVRYRAVPNIVEHMIEKVLRRKSGKVDIVERGLLKAYDRVVLIRH